MKIRTVQGLIFLLIASAISMLHADEPTIVLQVNESSPIWSEKLPLGGMGGEIVQAISKEMGIKTRIEFVPLKRLIADTTNNDLGNPLFYMDNQDFAAIIPIAVSYSSFFRYDKDTKKNVSMRDIKGKRIGILKGTISKIDIKRQFAIFEESYSKESLFKKLKAGRVDLVVELNLVGTEIIRTLFPNETEYFDVHIIPESRSPIAILIDSDYPNAVNIGRRYQEGLHRILKNGVYQKILEKYYTRTAMPTRWYNDLSKFETMFGTGL